MPKLAVHLSITLDGVIQAPGRPDEDTRGGFTHGGWANRYFDPAMLRAAAEGMARMPALLLGRRTYQDFFTVWPGRKDNPFSAVLDASQKYVASTTLREPLPWQNSTLLPGDAGDAVALLKARPGKDLLILGSGVLVQSLMRRSLIDEYSLLIHPLVLGTGHRLFGDDGTFQALELVKSEPTSTGVIMATYRPATRQA